MDRSPEKYARQLEMSRNWKKRNKERHAELARAYHARNKEKAKAQSKLSYAVRKGLIVRQPCEKCASTERIHGHHHDYDKPLEVRWLCYRCHKAEHPVDDEDKRVKFEGAKHASLPGVSNPNASLTEKDVIFARKAYEMGISQERIGKLLGVTQVTISRVVRNIRYSNV